MNFDIRNVIAFLKEKRKSFVSEADFQFALAWEIQNLYPDAKILLEYPVDFDKSMHLDILVILNNKWIPIELKHKTIEHGAIDLGGYNYFKDISRIEKVRKNKPLEFYKGYAIMITNFVNYKKPPQNNNVAYWDFRLEQDRKIKENSVLSFKEKFKLAKDYSPIELENEYTFKWDIYSKENDNNEDETWYILINEIYDYIKPSNLPLNMELLKEKFDDYFLNWDIKLSEKIISKRSSGIIQDSGWFIQYCFGKENGIEHLDFYAAHRMTNDRHHRIYEYGEMTNLPTLRSGYLTDTEDTEIIKSEELRKNGKEAYEKYNAKVTQMLVDKGFDRFTLNMSLNAGLVN